MQRYVDIGVTEGAQLRVDGREIRVEGREGGHFLGPCLFDRVRADMTIYAEEIFGPVLLLVRAETFSEAIELIAPTLTATARPSSPTTVARRVPSSRK